MNKSAIQKFAVESRRELIKQVQLRAYQYGITESNIGDASASSVDGRMLTDSEKSQRSALIRKINTDGYNQVMEEVAYTWFNRFIALRFMEVNNYLPSHIRVFSDPDGAFKPQIISEALTLELPGLDRAKVVTLIENNDSEALYRYLLLTQCNALNKALPVMFEQMDSYTELLLPNNILRPDGVIGKMISDIPEDDWKDAVQIIGWMYQYYNDERKNEVINIYKGTVKKDDIPTATQLFTTDWVVRYMVDNSLGRYWIERHPESHLAEKLEFFVTPKNGEVNYINDPVSPEDIKFYDPCMGSGHVLVYTFDVLIEIYNECGYSVREAVSLIVEKNLFGLDIDNRASQLAYFAVMMKAVSYDKRFLARNINPNLYAIDESNRIKDYLECDISKDKHMNDISNYLADIFQNAKETGSAIIAESKDFDEYINYLDNLETANEPTVLDIQWLNTTRLKLKEFASLAKILSQKYTVVCTNPPYLNKFEGNLKTFVTKNYKDYSGDLFSVFMYRNLISCKTGGYCGFMTPFVWMFIKTYEKLRDYILHDKSIATLVQMEYSAFEEATVPICSFVLKNDKPTENGLYFKLSDFKGGMEVQKQKVLEAIADKKCGYFYEADQSNFSKIPGYPVAYWISDNLREAFKNELLYNHSISPSQNVTGNNAKYVKKHWEIIKDKIGKKDTWIFYAKGGGYRKWWGNLEDIVNWTPDARNIYQFGDGKHASQIINKDYWYKKGITWGLITSAIPSFRVMPEGATYDKGGSTIIVDKNVYLFTIALLNSKVYLAIASLLNPTLNFQVKDVRLMPLVLKSKDSISIKTVECIDLSRSDWDSYENSWDFKRNPLV